MHQMGDKADNNSANEYITEVARYNRVQLVDNCFWREPKEQNSENTNNKKHKKRKRTSQDNKPNTEKEEASYVTTENDNRLTDQLVKLYHQNPSGLHCVLHQNLRAALGEATWEHVITNTEWLNDNQGESAVISASIQLPAQETNTGGIDVDIAIESNNNDDTMSNDDDGVPPDSDSASAVPRSAPPPSPPPPPAALSVDPNCPSLYSCLSFKRTRYGKHFRGDQIPFIRRRTKRY